MVLILTAIALLGYPAIRPRTAYEFRIDSSVHVIHSRSASRLGRGDLGVNRRRMDALTTALGDGSPGLRH